MKLLKFTDGQDVYDDFNSLYKRHKKGYIILGPPGIGKTTFVNSQKGSKKDWIDTDTIFGSKSLNVNWNNNKTSDDERLAYLRADYMLEQSKNMDIVLLVHFIGIIKQMQLLYLNLVNIKNI